MATLRLTNVKQLQSGIRKVVTKQARSKEVREAVGTSVVKQIQAERVPVTSEMTKKIRKYLELANKTDPAYNRNFINITFTGELLADLKRNVKASFTKSKITYVIEHSDKLHKKYKKPTIAQLKTIGGGTKRRKKGAVKRSRTFKGERKTYKQISDYVIAKGYKYLTFSRKTKQVVLNSIRRTIFRNFNNRLR